MKYTNLSKTKYSNFSKQKDLSKTKSTTIDKDKNILKYLKEVGSYRSCCCFIEARLKYQLCNLYSLKDRLFLLLYT